MDIVPTQTTMSNSTTKPVISAVFLSDIISDHELQIILTVNVVAITGFISIFGTICNILNIVIFVKQGVKNTTNISLLGIAVADTGALVTLLYGSICLNPLIIQRFENFEMLEIKYLTSAWPHVCFVRVKGWLTCFVTIERYLCIAYPLKVRHLISPQRAVVINAIVFIIMIVHIVPVFTSSSLVSRFSLSKNRTVIGIMYTSDFETIQGILLYFNNVSEFASFVIVAFTTNMLVHKLNYTTKWRKSTSIASTPGNISTRDQKVVLMVIVISIIFILCYFPIVVLFVAMQIEKDLSVTGKYKNLFSTLGVFMFLLEAVNSTVTIFVYLRMSSKYKETFLSKFTRTSNKRSFLRT